MGMVKAEDGPIEEPDFPLGVQNLATSSAVPKMGNAEDHAKLKKITKLLRQMLESKKQANMMAGGFYCCIIAMFFFHLILISR